MKKLKKTNLKIDLGQYFELKDDVKLWKCSSLPEGYYVGAGHATIMQATCNGLNSVLVIVKNVTGKNKFEIVESTEEGTLKDYRQQS